MNACLEILGRHGASGLGVRAVCRVANVSHRNFYDSFADADALLLATYQQAVGELLAEVGAAISAGGKEFRDQLRTGFDAATAFLENNAAYGRLIFQEALANEALRRHAAPTLPAFLLAARGMAEPDGAEPTLPLETALISGGLAAVFIEWLSGTPGFSRAELVDYCTDAMMAILFLER